MHSHLYATKQMHSSSRNLNGITCTACVQLPGLLSCPTPACLPPLLPPAAVFAAVPSLLLPVHCPFPFSSLFYCTPQAKQDATELQEQSKVLKAQIAELEEKEQAIIAERDAALVPIGNIVHDSVPISDNEVRSWGTLVGWWWAVGWGGGREGCAGCGSVRWWAAVCGDAGGLGQQLHCLWGGLCCA